MNTGEDALRSIYAKADPVRLNTLIVVSAIETPATNAHRNEVSRSGFCIERRWNVRSTNNAGR
jgi:hypothetical protein